MKITKKYRFKKGYGMLRVCDIKPFRDKLMERLGMKSLQGFYGRLNGKVEPKASEVAAIEETFEEFGITAENVWG